MDLIDEFRTRGLIHQATDLDAIRRLLDGDERVTVYYGCDPTADSLHHGNMIGLLMLRRFQNAGHRAIALAGGATGMVGDPSGRSDERNMLDALTLNRNVEAIKAQISRIVMLGDANGHLVDNREWMDSLPLLELLHEVGTHVGVNTMLTRDSVRLRLNSQAGISFTEFSYMVLQAYDFLHLYDNFGCVLQMGGSDQWGNIVSGVDLIRRKRRVAVHALSWPLLRAPDGRKLGKSTGARLWLDPNRTSPDVFYDHWLRLDSESACQQILLFSLRPLDELMALLNKHKQEPARLLVQRALAAEMTELVHGSTSSLNARPDLAGR
jgi:tyrosyl-tRNA synthetase